MPKILGVVVMLGLSIAIPASINASKWLWALWLVIGVAAVLMLAFSKPITQRIPWRLHRKADDPVLMKIVLHDLLRRDLQQAFARLGDMPNPSAPELRAFADNVARRLRDAGHDIAAKKAEVHLPDNATPADISKRRSDLHTQLMRLLIWDDYHERLSAL